MRQYLVLIALVTLSLSAAAQTNNMPTESTCGCKVVEAYKLTGDSSKKGKAYIYKDGVMFSFGGATKILQQITNERFSDEKDRLWSKDIDNNYNVFYTNSSKSVYFFKVDSPKGVE